MSESDIGEVVRRCLENQASKKQKTSAGEKVFYALVVAVLTFSAHYLPTTTTSDLSALFKESHDTSTKVTRIDKSLAVALDKQASQMEELKDHEARLRAQESRSRGD